MNLMQRLWNASVRTRIFLRRRSRTCHADTYRGQQTLTQCAPVATTSCHRSALTAAACPGACRALGSVPW
ncbi:hypothetical protein ACLQ8T_17155 (plasmid) [Glutamicibacter sp. FR1]|uniref:hypothetical protein n=1 Tax=Glutamicibacter sp. FR1 TaxID=3393744 RepID=UPI0039B00FD9